MQEHETTGGAPAPLEDSRAGAAEGEARTASAEKAATGMDAAIATGKRIAPKGTLRLFLSAQHPNTKFLVQVGEVQSFKAQDSPTGRRDTNREGDVWAQFSGGMLATNDPIVVEWCEAHGPDEDLHREYHRAREESTRACRAGHGVCCDAADPNAAHWVAMKDAQIPNASREATMSPGMDVDGLLQGKTVSGPVGGEGDRLVEAARITEEAIKKAQEED